ncbi:hypothetical protein HanXRQr2_Chr06g0247931 [Helianthus annuus]|uniref:Uncharacterized protein n=1 Tax=Helianthus annuus TaxID=4232 RepID=A0A9K3IR24_HELAN|nr:hypothetical protein HanXRQr2_Chr06g0247931 [Helianthus annuus]
MNLRHTLLTIHIHKNKDKKPKVLGLRLELRNNCIFPLKKYSQLHIYPNQN